MLHSIRTRPDLPPATDEPVDLLLTCHAKLRYFCELSLALATRPDLAPEQVGDASHRLLRYFTVALPLHEADEEETVTGALSVIATDAQIEALEQMRDQHRLIHDVLEELFPGWGRIAAEPKTLDGPTLLPHARRLAAVFDVHLDLEETTVFPMLATLERAHRKRLVEEMRSRRTPDVMNEMRKIV